MSNQLLINLIKTELSNSVQYKDKNIINPLDVAEKVSKVLGFSTAIAYQVICPSILSIFPSGKIEKDASVLSEKIYNTIFKF